MLVDTEMGRLASFESRSTSIPTARLVTCGFFYDRRNNQIRCCGCDYTLIETMSAEQQQHSISCSWRNTLVYYDSSTVVNPSATSIQLNAFNTNNHLIVETEVGIESLRSIPISYSNQTSDAESIRVHLMCSLRYFITNAIRSDEANSQSQELHLENTRVVKYERGPSRNNHDRLCLKNHVALLRWTSFHSLWQRRQLDAEHLVELNKLCFMLSRAGIFLIAELTGSTATHIRFRLELACSFCKRIILLDASFENSAEEIFANLLKRHRLGSMTCPTCLNLQGIYTLLFEH